MAAPVLQPTPSSSNQELLSTSWFDSAWIPALDQHNVLEYFSQRSNPFYDRTCNNEVIRMQRADPSQLLNMTGIEYMLLHVQEPILYVIRKAHRQSRDKVTPLANYYILGGVVYQCPDLQTVMNSRLLSAIHLVNAAFEDTLSYARYDPGKGYHWEFPDDKSEEKTKKPRLAQEEPSEAQRRRVDILLNELVKRFPPRAFTGKDGGRPLVAGDGGKLEKATGGMEGGSGGTGHLGSKRPGQLGADGGEGKPPDPKRKRT